MLLYDPKFLRIAKVKRIDKVFVFLGSIAALLGVGLGAFGAHGLRTRLSEPMMVIYQTGVHYHLVHAIGLILVGCVVHWFPRSALIKAAGWMLLTGIVLFSGSLYGLAITEIDWVGLITPVGGLAFLVGWALLALGVLKGERV